MYKRYLDSLKLHELVAAAEMSKENSSENSTVDNTIQCCWNEIERQCKEYNPLTSSQPPKRSGWRVVRVFVSSTFTDFFNEREILVKKVFPELREWCYNQHIHLIECDLRWGVPIEATSVEVIQTCMEELNRCHQETDGQPFFIGLLGNRYGWIPKDTDISHDLRNKFHWVDNTSITFMEILHGALRCRSPNAVFFMRDESILKSIPENQMSRFIDKESFNQKQLEELKKRLRQTFPEQVVDYSCNVDENQDLLDSKKVKFKDLDKFAEQATEFLKAAISQMYGSNTTQNYNEEDIELENQQYYMENKSEFVVGQDNSIKTLMSYLKGEPMSESDLHTPKEKTSFVRDPLFWGEPTEGDSRIMFVKGQPGFGKSSILSTVVRDFQKEGHDIFFHFVGCSGSSRNTEMLLKRLITYLKSKLSVAEDPGQQVTDGSMENLKNELKFLFQRLREQQTKCHIVIDAVNELEDNDTVKHLSWLPPSFPGNIKCIISCADNHLPSVARLEEHLCHMTTVEPITKESAKLIVTHSLQKFNKKLDEGQLETITSRSCATNPLWLTIMLEELRVFGDFRTLDDKISKVSDSVESLLADIVNRIITEDETGLVKKTLCLLACSQGSIQVQDLCNMLGDISKKEPVAPLYWSQTRRIVSPYIREIGIQSNISFYHNEIYKAVYNILIKGEDSSRNWSKVLGLYYYSWCQDNYLRRTHVAGYLQAARMDKELIEFLQNDPAAKDMYKSSYLMRLRCKFSTENNKKPEENKTVIICSQCGMKSTNINRHIKYKDSCVVCRAHVFYQKGSSVAALCTKHSFGHNNTIGKCFYCKKVVHKDKGKIKMGSEGKLCMQCSFGHHSKMCAVVSAA